MADRSDSALEETSEQKLSENPVTKSILNYFILALAVAFVGVTIVVVFRDLQPKIGEPVEFK